MYLRKCWSKILSIHFFRKLLRDKTFSVLTFLTVLSITGATAVYCVQGKTTQKALIEQMLHREQLITRSVAISLEDFLNDMGHDLAYFSTSEEIKAGGSAKAFVDSISSRPDIATIGVITVDENGIVTEDYNKVFAPDLGSDVSDREYFLWSKTAKSGNYYIANPVVSRVGLTKGQYVIPITVPVFDNNGKFDGAIVCVVSLRKLIDTYIKPLRVSDKTDVYMINSKAELIFSTVPEFMGISLTEITENFSFSGEKKVQEMFMAEFAKPTDEGKLDIEIPDMDQKGRLVRHLITYSGIDIGSSSDSKWYLVISTPASDAFIFAGIFYKDQLVSFIYFITVMLAMSMIGVTSIKLLKRKNND